jgi:hypothetical protein
MPEMPANSKQGWWYEVVVALPTAALALFPVVAIKRREVSLTRVVVACGLFAIVGVALFPIVRNQFFLTNVVPRAACYSVGEAAFRFCLKEGATQVFNVS